MSTTRQNILSSIKTTLEAIKDSNGKRRFTTIKTEDKQAPPSLDVTPLPLIFVWTDRENRVEDDRAVIGKETWEWYIVLEVWAKDKDMEELLSYIHTAMYNNDDFDHYACFSDRISVDFLTLDTTKQLEAMLVSYRVLYRHTRGVM